ncbi:PH domain-containing protein [Haloplanus sp. GCM10025708]|uniref:PH domain-containing protein n=1 Tax=Haloferacaceae TaxID=1644056 RepID=UPI00361FAB32
MTDETTPPDVAASTQTEYEVPEWLSLEDDEQIQWIGEPVPISIVGTAVWGLILTVVLIGFLILLTLPFSWFSIKNTDYVVTNKSLYVKKGVLSTNIESVALDKIQNTEYSQSFWGKQFGFGSIDISTAGSSGAEISLRNIKNARDVRETITSLSNEYSTTARQSKATGDEQAGATAPTTEGMDELIEELRATRQAMERIEQRLRDESESKAESVSPDEDTPR